ncbi:MAG: DMT family transporter, partial [Pseudomonadota bacterium]
LLAYMLGFSLAYQGLGAGIGALILFGVVQLTMFAGAAHQGDRPSGPAVQGALLGLLGLVVVLWPRDAVVDVPMWAAGFMIMAGVGWGVFSLAGKAAKTPLATTFRAFLACLPVMLLVALVRGFTAPDPVGLVYAALSGTVMSGLGYTLWYALLPRIATTSAALAQLTVPLIAMLGGVILLDETVGLTFVIGSALVLGGVFWPLWRRRQHASS